jgi:DNA-binding MarR family transcriptional regulator
MNAILFGTKRAFHRFVSVTRRPLQSFGLTAARFDMLFALMSDRPYAKLLGGATMQSDLRRTLGVSASVVSRMLRALEALGLIRRRRGISDRRQREVRLTRVGLVRIRDAYQSLRRAVQRLTETALCAGDAALGDGGGENRFDWKHRDKNLCFWQMLTLDDLLTALRRYFGDASTLEYYWGHPDD